MSGNILQKHDTFIKLMADTRSVIKWNTIISGTVKGTPMTKGELVKMVERNAQDYRRFAIESLLNNNHMNNLKVGEVISQTHIDAILVDFVNYVARFQGLDLGFYVKDLLDETTFNA